MLHELIRVAVLAGGVLILTATACGGDEADEWTGELDADSIIRAILDGDRDRFQDALETVERPCKQAAAGEVGEFICPQGTSADTARVFQVVACHAEYRTPDQIGAVAETFFNDRAPPRDWALYAVYRATDKTFGATYRVVFDDGHGNGRVAWLRSSGSIVLVELGCGTTPVATFVDGVSDFLVLPAG